MLLSDETMTEIQCKICGQIKDATCKQYPCSSKLPAFGAIAKAQLIADWDWFNEPCKEHSLTWVLVCLSGLLPNTIYTDVYNDNKIFYSHRYLCPECRAEFEAEVQKYKSEVKE